MDFEIAVKKGRQMAKDFAEDKDLGEDAQNAIDETEAPLVGGMDNRGQATGTAMRAVSLVVALTVGGIIAAFLLPIALDELVAVDTTAWSDGATALWDILDVIVVLAVFLFFIAVALRSADKI